MPSTRSARGDDRHTRILPPPSPVGTGPRNLVPIVSGLRSILPPSRPGCTSAYSLLNPCAVKRLCVERSPQRELLMSSRGRGGNPLSWGCLSDNARGWWMPPQPAGGLGPLAPLRLQRTEQHLLLLIYLPEDSPLLLGDLGGKGYSRVF